MPVMLPMAWTQGWISMFVDHLWQSTLFVLIAWLVAFALRKNQARTRYWIWMIASAKFFIPFSILINAGESLRTLFAAPIQSSALAATIDQIARPLSQAPSSTIMVLYDKAPTVGAFPAHPLSLLLSAIWFCGLLAVVISWAYTWLRIRKAVRSSTQAGLIGKVPILISRHLPEPAVFGIFRPVLLLPEAVKNRLSESQLRAIVAHEMYHIRRRDNLSAVIHMIVQAAFWFHPAVWWIKAHLMEERERACDEAVLQSGTDALLYAESILNVCKFCVESPLACMSGVGGSDLKQRIVRIMTKKIAHKLDFSRKVLLSITGIAVLALPVVVGLVHAAQVHAQATAENPAKDIAGTWQGTLSVGRDLRIVIKISKADDGAYKALFYSIDQAGDPIPATKVTLDGTTVKISVSAIGGNYEGKLASDGKTITGNWSQGPNPLPLNLTRATAETEWTIPPPTPKLPRMNPNATPAFEVATIKPSKPDQPGKAITVQGNRLRTVNITLSDLIAFAYGVQSKQVIGIPSWAGTDKFDIEGKPEGEGTPSDKQWKGMLQKLMADRFKLSFHSEKRELSVYALSVGKNGPKLTKSGLDPNGLPGLFFRGLGDLHATNATMTDFTQLLQSTVLDRPVVDQTGIEGRYDFDLKWTPDDSQFQSFGVRIPPPGENAPPPLYTAIQEQIGLKLDATKAPAEVLVIDHVEQPSEN
jgi:uncharacterized protein (TIGR03435 family)